MIMETCPPLGRDASILMKKMKKMKTRSATGTEPLESLKRALTAA
jgi:hypothetical protein